MHLPFSRLAGPPVIMATANRTSGPTPFGVSFCVRNDAALPLPPLDPDRTAESPPGRKWSTWTFLWDFGDPESGAWTHTGEPKNIEQGYSVTHVYRTPGTYTVLLRIIDHEGVERMFLQLVTVTDQETVFAGTATLRFDAVNGNDANDGSSWGLAKQSFQNYKATFFGSNGPRRVLLMENQTHTLTTGTSLSAKVGPFQIESYSPTGGRATIQFTTGATACFAMDKASYDLRIVNVNVDGNANGDFLRPGINCLYLGGTIFNYAHAVTNSSVHGNVDGFVMEDVNCNEASRYNVYFNHGSRGGFVGNFFGGTISVGGSTPEHDLRCYATQSIIAHNYFEKAGGSPRTMLKFDGYYPTGDPDRAGTEWSETVEFSVIRDNVFRNPRVGVAWMITLGPVDNTKDQRAQDCLFEENYLEGGGNAQIMVYANNRYWCLRNNEFNTNGVAGMVCIRVTQRGIEPKPVGYEIYNNSVYDETSSLVFCRLNGSPSPALGEAPDKTIVGNNYVVTTTGAGTMLEDFGTNTVTFTNPAIATSGMRNPRQRDFGLTAGASAIGAGTALTQVRTDSLRLRRGAVPMDAGARKYVPLLPMTASGAMKRLQGEGLFAGRGGIA